MAVVILGDEVSPPGLQLPAVILLLTLLGLAGFIHSWFVLVSANSCWSCRFYCWATWPLGFEILVDLGKESCSP